MPNMEAIKDAIEQCKAALDQIEVEMAKEKPEEEAEAAPEGMPPEMPPKMPMPMK